MSVPSDAVPSALAYNRAAGHPYHRLGVAVDSNMTVEDGLRLIGCDEEVIEHRDLFVHSDIYKGEWVNGIAEKANDFSAIYSSKYGVMGVRKPTYEIIDRRDTLQIAMDLIGLYPDDAALDVIGNVGDKGEVFFAYIKLPQWIIDPKGLAEEIERGFVVMTSFNGQYKTTINETMIRPVCMNALILGTKQMVNGIATTHLGGAEERLRRMAAARDFAGAKEREVEDRIFKMMKVPGDKAIGKLADHFFPIRPGMSDRVRTRRLQARSSIFELYDGHDNVSSATLGFNGYAAYQAFVEHQDHRRLVRTRGGDDSKAKARAATMPGPVFKTKYEAQQIVLSLA